MYLPCSYALPKESPFGCWQEDAASARQKKAWWEQLSTGEQQQLHFTLISDEQPLSHQALLPPFADASRANTQRYLHLEVVVWSRGIWALLSSSAAAGGLPWFCFNAKYENLQEPWCLFSRPYIQHITPHVLKPFLLQEGWGVNSPWYQGALDPKVLTPTVAEFVRHGYLVFL